MFHSRTADAPYEAAMSEGALLFLPAAQVAAGKLCLIHRSIESACHMVWQSYFQSRTNDFHRPCVVSGWILFALWMETARHVSYCHISREVCSCKGCTFPGLCARLQNNIAVGLSHYVPDLFTCDTTPMFQPWISVGTDFNPMSASYKWYVL